MKNFTIKYFNTKTTSVLTLLLILTFNMILAQSPTNPAQGYNVFVQKGLTVTAEETKGAVAVGKNLTIKGDYKIGADTCGEFTTTGSTTTKIGLLVNGRVNYPLNTIPNTTDCDCGDATTVINGSFETNSGVNTWRQFNENDLNGWSTTATDNKIEIWKSGFLGKTAQNGNYLAEINATQRASLYQSVCAEPGSVLEWSIYHRGRDGVDVAEVLIGSTVASASVEQIMSTDKNAWVKYSGTYTVPAGQYKTYFVFKGVSSSPNNNISYGNLIDNFQVTKTTNGSCPPATNADGLLTIVDPSYYVKIGNANGSSSWYFDELNAPANMRITPDANYNASSRIQLSNNSPALGVSSSDNPVYENNLIDFSSAFQTMKTSATSMSQCNNSVSIKNASNQPIANTNLPSDIKIDLQNGANYLNITGADLNNVNNITFNQQPNANKYLIVNVDAADIFKWNVWNQNGIASTESPYIIYNFYNAGMLVINGTSEIYGTVFAPSANIKKSNNKADLYGQVIGKTLNHDGGIIHCSKFIPSVTSCATPTSIAPTAEFNLNVDPQCLVGNEYQFTNTTNTNGTVQPNHPITYAWNFGDGTTSTMMNPTKTYATAGTYTVTLIATNTFGSDTTTKQVEVLANTEPNVTVNTTNTNAGSVTKELSLINSADFNEFSWAIPSQGSGLFQDQATVSFTFTQAGTYNVTLTAINNGCTSVKIIPVVVTSAEVSTGNSGGLESESLGDAVTKLYVNRKKNSVPTIFKKSKENAYNKQVLQQKQPYQGKGQSLLDMFPTELVAGNVANVTSPTDILDYTVADEVLSVDFSINGKTKGVVLGVRTTDKIYNHTKASCDRLKGAEILNVQSVALNGQRFLMQEIKQRNGIVEYAISFAIGKNSNQNNYSLQTNWYVNHYTKSENVYNFQVWSTNPTDTQKLVKDILSNLNAFAKVNQTEKHSVPKTYVSKVYREKNELVMNLKSTEKSQSIEVSMEEIYSETANNVKHRYNPVSSELTQTLRIDISDGYEYDGLVKVDGKIQDAFYHADGNWGLDFDSKYTEIKEYLVSNDFNREYNEDEYAVNRNVKIKATSEYDYLGIYKSLLPGNLPADYTQYKYVKFTAKGSGLIELSLIKSSIENWKEQYKIMIDLSEEEQTYYVPFDLLTSTGTTEKMVANDLTTLNFTFLPVEANTKELDLEISDVSFAKSAPEDKTVAIIEEFENNFMAYPNPSQGDVNVLLYSKVDTEVTVTLTDITGKIIYSAPTTLTAGKNELDFNFNVKPGLMLLKIASKQIDYGTSKVIFR